MKNDDRKFKRKCIICGKYCIKSELVKLTYDKNTSELVVNKKSKVFGRSFYICKNEACLNKSLEPNVLSKYTKLNHVEKAIKYIFGILKYKKY